MSRHPGWRLFAVLLVGGDPAGREWGMTTRLYDPTTPGPVVRGILVVTMAVIVIGVLALVRATMGARTHHVTVRVDNQTGLVDRNWAITIPAGTSDALEQAGFQ
jgi:hypothetical protein